MGTSPCISKRHSDYDCLIRWGVTRKTHGVDRWCEVCRSTYSNAKVVQEWRSGQAK
jgi:hypothetical protein